jgi:hypothetical protein
MPIENTVLAEKLSVLTSAEAVIDIIELKLDNFHI